MPIKRDCDLCRHINGVTTEAVYDAKTLDGPWAYLCQDHYDTDAHPGFKTAATLLNRVK